MIQLLIANAVTAVGLAAAVTVTAAAGTTRCGSHSSSGSPHG
ncbi:hypothetical protein P3H80_29545 [Mycolicibacterium septicum]|nr:hypothetical protein [Mycolicibacterium septicum]MDF3341599.1 hypothetical protein [Mycolicibacterium septicum]